MIFGIPVPTVKFVNLKLRGYIAVPKVKAVGLIYVNAWAEPCYM
jgi:hypothetical protein